MKVLVFLSLIALVFGQSLTLKATIRDFTPGTCGDFEGSAPNSQTGLVKNQLDASGKPEATNPVSFICFNSWYRSVKDVNIEIPIEITLTDSGNGIFTFSSDAFFPIDKQGFGDFAFGHNFHFTTEIATTFTFNANAASNVFTFTGDDDVWVFIDNKLAVDLGGLHSALSASVDLNTLGLVDGTTYNLNVFHAERHTGQSNFRIDTTLTLIPEDPQPPQQVVVDLCGVTYLSNCAQDTVCDTKVAPAFNSFTKQGDIKAAFLQYNLVSFGNTQVATGDTEGRVAVGGSFTAGNGYSVGNTVFTTGANKILDPATFALIVNGNLNWLSGSVEPLGPNFTPGYANPSNREITFVTGALQSVPVGVEVRTTPPPSAAALGNDFADANKFYSRVQLELDALTNNALVSLGVGNTITIDCQGNAAASSYVADVDPAVISTGSSWSFAGCNPNAQYIFNIGGTGSVSFQGNHLNLPGDVKQQGQVVYNVVGSGRTITVNTRVFGHIIAPNNNLVQNGGVIVGLVVVGTYSASGASQVNQPRCPAPPPQEENPPQPPEVCPYFENEFTCNLGLRLGNVLASFKDFNVVSFDSFTADTGDVQGRVIVAKDLTLGNGYSIGDQIDSTPTGHDNSLPFAAIVGRNLKWGSGALFPDVSPPSANQGNPEGLFVGGSILEPTPDFLKNRRIDVPLSTLQSDFVQAFECYTGIQDSLASRPTDVDTVEEFLGLHVTCRDLTADAYTLNVDAAVINRITWYTVDNCNFNARWTINVLGNGNVNFNGDHFPAISGGVVYNILGSGRTINVNTQVNGNILAPKNIINQRGGVIVGKVVAGNVAFALQVNVPNCPDDIEPEIIPIIITTPCATGTIEYEFEFGGGCIKPGDKITLPDGKECEVEEVKGNKIKVKEPFTSTYGVGSKFVVNVEDPVRARVPEPRIVSSAGAVSASVLLIVAALALLF